jgi:hypothetical protein
MVTWTVLFSDTRSMAGDLCFTDICGIKAYLKDNLSVYIEEISFYTDGVKQKSYPYHDGYYFSKKVGTNLYSAKVEEQIGIGIFNKQTDEAIIIWYNEAFIPSESERRSIAEGDHDFLVINNDKQN